MAKQPSNVSNRSRPMTKEERKVIIASSAGTIFEWYDFYLYGSLAAIIGANYFTAFNNYYICRRCVYTLFIVFYNYYISQ